MSEKKNMTNSLEESVAKICSAKKLCSTPLVAEKLRTIRGTQAHGDAQMTTIGLCKKERKVLTNKLLSGPGCYRSRNMHRKESSQNDGFN